MASAFEKWLGTLQCEDDYTVERAWQAAHRAGYAAAVERLMPWLKHDDGCRKFAADRIDKCTCGLDAAMKWEE